MRINEKNTRNCFFSKFIGKKAGRYAAILLMIIALSNIYCTRTLSAGIRDDHTVIETVLTRIFHPDEDMIQIYDNWRDTQEVITASKWNATFSFPNKEMEAFYNYFTEEGYEYFTGKGLSATCFDAYRNGYKLSFEKVEISEDRLQTGHYGFNVSFRITGKDTVKTGVLVTGKAYFDESTHKINYFNLDSSSMATAFGK